jgi:hypothetical protein
LAATYYKDEKIILVRRLLKVPGIDINKSYGTMGGITPLMKAAANGYLEIIDMLIKYGADVNKYDKDGDTALFASIHRGHLDSTLKLIELGAQINHKNKNGDLPLTVAVVYNHFNIIKIILELDNIQLNNKNNFGNTLLIGAVSQGNINIVKALLDYHKNDVTLQVDPNIKNNIGITSLMRAVQRKDLNILKLLLNDDRIQQNIINNDGLTAYLLAATEGYVEGIQAFHEDTAIAYGALEGPIEFIPPPSVEPSTLMEGKMNQGMIDIPDNTFDIFTQDPITEGQLVVRIHQINDDFFLLDEWTTYINKYSSRNKSNQIINPVNRQPVTPDQVDIFTAHIIPKKDEDLMDIPPTNTNGGYRRATRKRRRR